MTRSRSNSVSKTDTCMKQQAFESPQSDLRRSKRFSIQAPAVARIRNREIWAFTRNVSTCGAYLSVAADEELPDVGEILDLVIKVPPTISAARPCFIVGRGRIIRTVERQWDESGIAVEILDFAIQSKSSFGFRDPAEITDPGTHGSLDVA